VVGSYGTAYHFDGQRWTATDVMSRFLVDVWGFGPHDVWAPAVSGEILHWDGTRWGVAMGRDAVGLWKLWGSGPDDLWAGGKNGKLIHWDGRAWTPVTTSLAALIVDIGGTGPRDVWVTDSSGAVLHWDGTRWDPSATGALGGGDKPAAMVGFPPDDIWFVGSKGTVIRWDGQAWLRTALTLPGGVHLAAAHGVRPDDLWLVGSQGALYHHDGRRFTKHFHAEDLSEPKMISGSGPQDLWLVSRTGLWRWQGKSWVQPVGAPRSPGQVQVLGPNEVWVTSYDIQRWDGNKWSAGPRPPGLSVELFWASRHQLPLPLGRDDLDPAQQLLLPAQAVGHRRQRRLRPRPRRPQTLRRHHLERDADLDVPDPPPDRHRRHRPP
jgi:hypothetical protein